MNFIDDALAILNKDISNFDSITFKTIYVFYLERIIYIYIKKRNFKIAYKYVFEKRKFIDDKNRDEVNRWYLEMAYVYAELNEKSKALTNLKAILENLPDDELLSHTLSNLTKLYIDQGLIEEAKQTLNQCLSVTIDNEGKTYCNYLLAQILVQENKPYDALVLYEEIFSNEINPDYITLCIDYLELLINQNKVFKAQELINKMSLIIDDVEDLNIKRTFLVQKLKMIVKKYNLDEASNLVDSINIIDNQIISKDLLSLNENIEDEKLNEINNSIIELTSKIEMLINFMNIAFSTNSLRDLFMEFSKKLEMIIGFDEASFVIFDKVIPNQKHDDILLYNYKKERLYEKIISYDNLKNTIIETILINGKEAIIDLTDSAITLNELGSNKTYQDKEIRYIYALPFLAEEELFLTVIFKSKIEDLTLINNSILLKVASKLLEMKVLNYFISEKLKVTTFVNEAISQSNQIHTIYHYGDKVILSDGFKSLLKIDENQTSLEDFMKLMLKNDRLMYSKHDFSKKGNFNLEYHLKINSKFTKVIEKLVSYENEQDLFFVGSIEIIGVDELTYDDDTFIDRVNQLKNNINNLEFKFSLVRINADLNEYENIQNTFNTKPYYLSDQTYCIVLENEVNQRTLDKYIKNYEKNASIIRYPRDLINIDDIINFSKISLENNILYFTDEMYQKYLKKVSVNNLVLKMLDEKFELWYLKLNSYNNKTSYEVRSKILGLTNKDNIRELISKDLLFKYDNKLYNSVDFKNSKVTYYIPLSSYSLNYLLEQNEFKLNQNQVICLDYIDSTTISNIKKIKQLGIKVYLDYKVLNSINIYDLCDTLIDGLIISEGLQKDIRANIIKIATNFNYILYTNYEFNDYSSCVYKTEEMVMDV